jgi:hypothetical protein
MRRTYDCCVDFALEYSRMSWRKRVVCFESKASKLDMFRSAQGARM